MKYFKKFIKILAILVLVNSPALAANTSLPELGAGTTVAAGDLFISRQGADTSDKQITTTQLATGVYAISAANLTLATGGGLLTSQSAGNTALIRAYDVDGASYTTFCTLTANNSPAMSCTNLTLVTPAIGAATGASLVLTSSATAAGVIAGGTKFTVTGCSASATVGGAFAGQFTSGATGACTAVITINGATGLTAPNGWSCWSADETTGNLYRQTASSTTTATLSGTTVTNDVITFGCVAY